MTARKSAGEVREGILEELKQRGVDTLCSVVIDRLLDTSERLEELYIKGAGDPAFDVLVDEVDVELAQLNSVCKLSFVQLEGIHNQEIEEVINDDMYRASEKRLDFLDELLRKVRMM